MSQLKANFLVVEIPPALFSLVCWAFYQASPRFDTSEHSKTGETALCTTEGQDKMATTSQMTILYQFPLAEIVTFCFIFHCSFFIIVNRWRLSMGLENGLSNWQQAIIWINESLVQIYTYIYIYVSFCLFELMNADICFNKLDCWVT